VDGVATCPAENCNETTDTCESAPHAP
jgi:hypothetical protein